MSVGYLIPTVQQTHAGLRCYLAITGMHSNHGVHDMRSIKHTECQGQLFTPEQLRESHGHAPYSMHNQFVSLGAMPLTSCLTDL